MARVLVVDDDPSTVQLVTFRLQSQGHRVIGATSPQEALDVVATHGHPDIVVLDVSMPEMSGMELLSALRTQEGMGDIPAIFLSARVLPEDIAAGRALGASYLTKPFIASALLKVIDEALAPSLGTW
jgi:CheY-like chemotaxis protein